MVAFNLRVLLLAASAFFILSSLPRDAAAEAVRRPNIVFILADDVGREVLGCYGGSSYRTPNLDQLSATGARFEHCYSMPVCHPTRVCLLTGRYPRHLGSPRWGTFPEAAESQTFAHVVKRAGYATAIAGKWQICMMKDDLDHPRRLGFDEWSLFGWHEGPRYHDPFIYENGKLRSDTEGEYGPDLYVDFLADFMQRNKDQPFLAFYSMALCHDVTDDLPQPVPYGPRGRYDNYREMANQMDVQIGRLMDAIDALGIRENTLILFTTDNGTAKRTIIRAENGEFIREQVISTFRGKSIPGGKTELTDWGTRVPLIANWKGVTAAGQVRGELVDFSDLLPTIAELTGGKLPEGVTLDGHSFAGLLTGNGTTNREWAYAESRVRRFFAKTRRWKLYNSGQFYDTENDPDEQHPILAGERPAESEAAYELLSAAVRQLKARTSAAKP